MQEAIRKILFKLNDHVPLHNGSNKENRYKNMHSIKDPSYSIDDVEKLSKRIQRLECTIDSLITDANTVVRYYQELLRESADKYDQLRQEFAMFKVTTQQEKDDEQRQMVDLNRKIEELNQQINRKSIAYHDLLQKYEEYEEDNSQVRLQTEDKFKKIKESITKETLEYEHMIQIQQIRIDDLVQENQDLAKKLEEITSENLQIKGANQELRETLGRLHQQMHLELINKQTWTPDEEDEHDSCGDLLQPQSEDLEENFTFQEIKMNFSHEETHTNHPKDILDISQHYSKYNRTEEYLSKEKICSLLEMNSNESKPFRLGRVNDLTLSKGLKFKQNSNSAYVKIDTIESKDQIPNSSSHDSKNRQKIQQFQMVEINYEQDPPINPYRAFFCLMVQSEKMNSSSFNSICDKDFNYLYDKFVQEGIPYNLWHRQIRKSLKAHSSHTC